MHFITFISTSNFVLVMKSYTCAVYSKLNAPSEETHNGLTWYEFIIFFNPNHMVSSLT